MKISKKAMYAFSLTLLVCQGLGLQAARRSVRRPATPVTRGQQPVMPQRPIIIEEEITKITPVKPVAPIQPTVMPKPVAPIQPTVMPTQPTVMPKPVEGGTSWADRGKNWFKRGKDWAMDTKVGRWMTSYNTYRKCSAAGTCTEAQAVAGIQARNNLIAAGVLAAGTTVAVTTVAYQGTKPTAYALTKNFKNKEAKNAIMEIGKANDDTAIITELQKLVGNQEQAIALEAAKRLIAWKGLGLSLAYAKAIEKNRNTYLALTIQKILAAKSDNDVLEIIKSRMEDSFPGSKETLERPSQLAVLVLPLIGEKGYTNSKDKLVKLSALDKKLSIGSIPKYLWDEIVLVREAAMQKFGNLTTGIRRLFEQYVTIQNIKNAFPQLWTKIKSKVPSNLWSGNKGEK